MSPPPPSRRPNDPTARAELALKVVPGAKRDGIAGWLGEALKIRVSAPPEKGRANEAVVRVLAEALALDARAIRVVSGASSPRKRVAFEGLGEDELRERIEHWLARLEPERR
jgi:hypothetical protein